jgi:hypothetical protein
MSIAAECGLVANCHQLRYCHSTYHGVLDCRYALSPMAKLMKTGIGSGKGLVALDGAAQADIIPATCADAMPYVNQLLEKVR